jgi:hypothetical protein
MNFRFLSIFTAVAFSISLTACNETNEGSKTKDKIETNLELYDGKFGTPTPTPGPSASPSPTPTPIPVPSPPVINALPAFFKTNTFNVTGTGTLGTTVNLILGGSVVGTNDITEGTNWLIPVGPLSDGSKLFTAVAKFPGGEISAPSNESVTIVDTGSPNAPTITGPTAPSTNGLPEVTGTGEASSTITLFFNGTENGTTNATTLSTWIYIPGTALTNGVYATTATATDAAGNISVPSAPFNITVDTIAPAAPVITGPAGGVSSIPQPTISGTAEADVTIRLFVDDVQDGVTVSDGDGDWALTVAEALVDGTYTFTARAVDDGGLVSPVSDDFILTVDQDAPAAPSVTGPTSPVTATRTPEFSGTATAGANVIVYVNGAADGVATASGGGIWNHTSSDPLANGTYQITAQVDQGGTLSPLSAPLSVTVNVTDPAP